MKQSSQSLLVCAIQIHWLFYPPGCWKIQKRFSQSETSLHAYTVYWLRWTKLSTLGPGRLQVVRSKTWIGCWWHERCRNQSRHACLLNVFILHQKRTWIMMWELFLISFILWWRWAGVSCCFFTSRSVSFVNKPLAWSSLVAIEQLDRWPNYSRSYWTNTLCSSTHCCRITLKVCQSHFDFT